MLQIIKKIAYSFGFASTLLILLTLIFSATHDFSVHIVTNTYNECYFEIIFYIGGLFCWMILAGDYILGKKKE